MAHSISEPWGDNLRAFPVSAGRLSFTPSSITANQFSYPGATPSISANGMSNGIVWAAENSNPAVLHAYDATNLNRELYNSNQAANGRDEFGAGNKFITPTIADGKVFVGSQNSVGVFGLLQQSPPSPRATSTGLAASAQSVTAGARIMFEINVTSGASPLTLRYQTVTLVDGATPIARRALNPQGRADFATSALTVGTHSIRARYPGGEGYLPSDSPPLEITINAPLPAK
jgi:hypothetical protein